MKHCNLLMVGAVASAGFLTACGGHSPLRTPQIATTVNIERGNQATPGPASQVLGNVANTVPDCAPQVYQVKTVKSPAPLTVASDARGDILFFFGLQVGESNRGTGAVVIRGAHCEPGSHLLRYFG
ncbi:MAG: hypothetical protein V4633_10335 [Pseudomonadota bacterium]